VTVVRPEQGEGADVVMGTIVANRQVNITPEATGRIKTLHAKLGSYVKKGTPLVTLDPRNAALNLYQATTAVRVAKAALRVARTGLSSAHSDYRRYKKLHETKTVSDAAFEKVKTAWLTAQGQVSLAKRQLEAARAVAAVAFKGRQDVVTRAPFSGYVTRVMMNEGDMVRSMPPSHVLRLVDVTPVVVEASIGELLLAKLPKPGQPVKLVIPGLGHGRRDNLRNRHTSFGDNHALTRAANAL
jgi:RND family efflux transporter MFP subunit